MTLLIDGLCIGPPAGLGLGGLGALDGVPAVWATSPIAAEIKDLQRKHCSRRTLRTQRPLMRTNTAQRENLQNPAIASGLLP